MIPAGCLWVDHGDDHWGVVMFDDRQGPHANPLKLRTVVRPLVTVRLSLSTQGTA